MWRQKGLAAAAALLLGYAALAAQDDGYDDALPIRVVDPFVSPMVHQGGTVVLRVGVTPTGVVSSVDVVSGFPALTAPVVDAVRQWRFAPARRDNRAVPAETTVVVHVALQRSIAPPPR